MSQIAASGSSRVGSWAGIAAAASLSLFVAACFGNAPPTVNTFCASDVGEVSGPDVPNVGTIQQCNQIYPTCTPPPMTGPGWQCCASLQSAPLQTGIQCMGANGMDAGAD